MGRCPQFHNPCPCMSELVRHTIEPDAQTADIVAFWSQRETMTVCWPRELLPPYKDVDDG